MGKYFKFLLLVMVALGLMSGSAFGAAALNAGNTTLAAEKISPTTDYSTAGINTAYQTGGPVISSTVIRVSLTNGKFTAGDTIGIWNSLSGDYVGNGVVPPAPNNTMVDITLTSPLDSGIVYQIINCITGPPLTGVSVPAGSAAGTTVTLNVDSLTVPGDPNVAASATAITVKNQFSATLSPVTSKLSFADNMETFIISGSAVPYTKSATESQAALTIVWTDLDDDTPNITDNSGCADTLAATESITAKITGNLTGISAVEYNDANPYAITATDRTNGYATLTVAGNNLKMCKSTDSATAKALELTAADVTGSPIVTGTRTGLITLKTGTDIAAADRALVADTASHIVQLDATTLHLPFVRYKTDGSLNTAIVLQTNEATTGANGVQVVAIDATGVERTLTIAGKTEVTEGTPLMILASEIFSALEAAGYTSPTLGAIKTTGVKVVVNTPETKVRAYATINAATGDPRLVPIRIEGPASITTSILR